MHAFTIRYSGRVNVLTTDVGIALPFDPSGGIPDPSMTIKAIWDTGASMSVITKKLVSSLGLKPSGKIKVRNTSAELERDTYIVNLYLPNKVMIPFVKVVDCEDVLGHAEMLIGMDIITSGDFSITNVDNKTMFSFINPPSESIDYVKKVNIINNKSPVIKRIEDEKRRRLINNSKKHKKKRQK